MRLDHSSSRDLFARAKVTQALENAKPVYKDVGTIDWLLTEIKATTGIVPRLLSFGPTADDKETVAVGSLT